MTRGSRRLRITASIRPNLSGYQVQDLDDTGIGRVPFLPKASLISVLADKKNGAGNPANVQFYASTDEKVFKIERLQDGSFAVSTKKLSDDYLMSFNNDCVTFGSDSPRATTSSSCA